MNLIDTLPKKVRDEALTFCWPRKDRRRLSAAQRVQYEAALEAYAQGYQRAQKAEQDRSLADLRKQKHSPDFGEKVSRLPIDQRRQILDDLRAELAALREESEYTAPLPTVGDPNELVDAAELAQLRAMWGDE